ncbi:MAG: SpaA isopeptide-forming pilin-related protein, partial [Chloroflexota bacterium]
MFSGDLRLRRGAQARRSVVFFWTALFVLSIGLQYAVATAPAPVIAASGLKAGTVAGFEVDGDLVSGNAASNPGAIPAPLIDGLTNAQDWLDGNGFQGLVDPADPPTSFIFRDAVDSASVPGDVTPDTSAYAGGNKESDTRDWGYFNNAGPNDKTDYRHVMAGVKVSGANPYVFLGAERIATNGVMVVDFELNQKPFKVFAGAPGVSKPDRSVHDILISLEYSNGGSNPIVTLYRVSAVQEFSTGQVATFATISDATTINAVRSATNFQALANVAFPSATYNVEAFAWAEASVNIAALGLPVTCLNFGQGSIRSRTGGSPSTSQLKDASQPFPLSVNTCAEIQIIKRDPAGNPLGGATFSISPNPLLGAPASPPLSITDNDANDTDPRDGYILLGPCEPQVEYTVTETTAPAGYIKDPVPQSKTAAAGQTVTFTFENDLGSIRWEKNGPNGTSLLGGATFTITPNPKTGSGTLTVVDNGGNDADATAGELLVTGVLVDRAGGYTIAETTPPAGYIGSPATANANPTSANPNVAIAAGTWVNTLGSIAWVKNGPDGSSLLGGATFRITPNPKTGSGTLTVVDNDANDADPTAGEFLVTNARVGT